MFWGENVAFQNGGEINQLTILWDRRYKERGGFSEFPPAIFKMLFEPISRCLLSAVSALVGGAFGGTEGENEPSPTLIGPLKAY